MTITKTSPFTQVVFVFWFRCVVHCLVALKISSTAFRSLLMYLSLVGVYIYILYILCVCCLIFVCLRHLLLCFSFCTELYRYRCLFNLCRCYMLTAIHSLQPLIRKPCESSMESSTFFKKNAVYMNRVGPLRDTSLII